MKKKQPIRGHRRPTAGLGGMLSLLSGTLVLSASIAVIVLVSAPGCANQRLVDLQRGESCSAEKVREYAKAHNMSYEQALEVLHQRDQEDWAAVESRQLKLPAGDAAPGPRASTTVVPEKPQPSKEGYTDRRLAY